MTGYVIKGTYKGGKHTGEEFILTAGGYVADRTDVFLEHELYKNERTAKMVATKYNKKNEFDAKHHPGITNPCKYEYVAVEA